MICFLNNSNVTSAVSTVSSNAQRFVIFVCVCPLACARRVRMFQVGSDWFFVLRHRSRVHILMCFLIKVILLVIFYQIRFIFNRYQ